MPKYQQEEPTEQRDTTFTARMIILLTLGVRYW